MKQFSTLSNWLSNRYQLIIRNDDNFAEKHTFSFSYAKLIILIVFFFLGTSVLSYFVFIKLFDNWLDPRYERMILQNEVHLLQNEVDSLSNYLDASNRELRHIQLIMQGKNPSDDLYINREHISENNLNNPVEINKSSSIEEIFKKNVEKDKLINTSYIPIKSQSEEEENIFFFPPITRAEISGPFDLAKKHFGIDLVAKKGTPIKATYEGIVFLADKYEEGGQLLVIQHINGFVSVYQHNSSISKKKGDYVKTGEVIAIIGNTGTLSYGLHLHFELWHYGVPINPEKFIDF